MLDEFFERMDRSHERSRREFEKLATDPPRPAEVGERVLVSGGPLHMGFDWVRHEAVVLEVAATAYRLQFVDRTDKDGNAKEMWVHRFIVTDVLETPVEEEI